MNHVARAAVLASAALLALGCADAVGPDDLVVDVDIVPSVVAPGDSFSVHVTIANPTSETIRITPESCAGFGRHRAFRDGEPIELDGMITDPAEVLCIAAPGPVEVAPGVPLTHEWPIRASVDGEPAPSGSYTFRLEPLVEDLDVAEAAFAVE